MTDCEDEEITDTSSIAFINPIRYRGYYYDNETGLDYLQSRYYNPEWGRFISADGYVSTGQGLNDANMFTYCGNNPANNADNTGKCFHKVPYNFQYNYFCNTNILNYNSSKKQTSIPQRTPEKQKQVMETIKEKPNMVPRKDKKKGSDGRQKVAIEKEMLHILMEKSTVGYQKETE